jgi:hypothetical protein
MFARDQQTIPFIEQWERANRWFTTVQGAYRNGTHADEMMDLFFAAFQNLFVAATAGGCKSSPHPRFKRPSI